MRTLLNVTNKLVRFAEISFSLEHPPEPKQLIQTDIPQYLVQGLLIVVEPKSPGYCYNPIAQTTLKMLRIVFETFTIKSRISRCVLPILGWVYLL